jgi:hypothetical protein
MISTKNARIEAMVAHQVGNSLREEALQLADMPLDPESYDRYQEKLLGYFFKDLPHGTIFRFSDDQHPVALQIQTLLEEPNALVSTSTALAKRLYDAVFHDKIKSGMFLVVRFQGVTYQDEPVPAIGLFKAETFDYFMDFKPKQGGFKLNLSKGFPIRKMDKGCVFIPDASHPSQWLGLVADRHAEARYWMEGFLGLKPVMNEAIATRQALDLVKKFSEDVLSPENDTPRSEQMAFLQKSASFFETHEEFDVDVFQSEVIQAPELREAFQDYKAAYQEEVPVMEKFKISPEAVRKEHPKFVRSVIKLDKNFHLYVHGNGEMIEKGFDEEKGMSYYKLFFNDES